MSDHVRNNTNPSPGSARVSDDDGQEIPITYFIGDLIDPDEVHEVEEVRLPPHPLIMHPITPGLSDRYPGDCLSAEEGGGGVANQPGATRHFSDTEVLAYVSMRGITGHGHYYRDEALEPLARVMYEPRRLKVPGARTVSLGQEASRMIESAQEEVGRAILDLEMGSGEPGVEESAAALRGEEVTVWPLQPGQRQDDNRHNLSNDGTETYQEYQGYQEYEDQEQEDRSRSDDLEDVQGTDGKEGKGEVSQTPPSSSIGLGLSETGPIISPFGFQSRGRYYQSHSAITEVSERTNCADCSRKVSNGSSNASDGSANSNESSGSAGGGIFSTPSTPPKDKDGGHFIKTTSLMEGDVSDDEDINAGVISPRTFLKLAEGCMTKNRAFRVGGPAKVRFPINLERTRPNTPPINGPEDLSSSPSHQQGKVYERQFDVYDGYEMSGIYSVSSNPSVKWTATGVDHTKFAGKIENFTFDRMDPFAGRELAQRRYCEAAIGKDFEDDMNDDESVASGPNAAPAAAGAEPTILEDGTRPVSNINDYSPVRVPDEEKPTYVYVGDLPRVNIDERNIPPLRKTVHFNPELPEQKARKIVSVPPGFEKQFSFHARELLSSSPESEGVVEASSSAIPVGGDQNIDWKGKGRMVDEVPSASATVNLAQNIDRKAANAEASSPATGIYGQHNINWKDKGPEVIFPKSLSSPSSGSSLEMTELKAGPPPKLSDYPVETSEAGTSELPHGHRETQQAGPSELPYAHVETFGHNEAEAAITKSTVPLAFGVPGNKAREWLNSHNKAIADMQNQETEMRAESASLERDVDELERIRPFLKELISLEIFNRLNVRLTGELTKEPLAFGGLFAPGFTTNEQFTTILNNIISQPLPTRNTNIKPSESPKELDNELDPARAARIRQYFNEQMIQLKYKLDAQDAAITNEEHRQAKLREKKDQKITQTGEILEELQRLGVQEETDQMFAEAQAAVRKEMAEEEERRVQCGVRQEWMMLTEGLNKEGWRGGGYG